MSEVLTARDGAVLTITLNRPEVFNALNAAAARRACARRSRRPASPDVRAVVITGAGRGFCSGQDLTEFQDGSISVRERARADLPPEHPPDPRAREARHRRRQRPVRRRGALARSRLRPPDRERRRHLRPRLHRHRPDPRLRRLVVHPPAARLRARVRLDDDEQAPDRRRGPRVGARRGGGRGRPARGARRRGGRDLRDAADPCDRDDEAPVRPRLQRDARGAARARRRSCSRRRPAPPTSPRASRRFSRSASRASPAASSAFRVVSAPAEDCRLVVKPIPGLAVRGRLFAPSDGIMRLVAHTHA